MRSVEVMFPILFALAILVWMWAAAMRHVVQQVADYSHAIAATGLFGYVGDGRRGGISGNSGLVYARVAIEYGVESGAPSRLEACGSSDGRSNRCAGALAAASTNVGFQSGDPHF
jgi:hypothetical protein